MSPSVKRAVERRRFSVATRYNAVVMAEPMRRPVVLAVDDDRAVLDVLHLLLDDRYEVFDAQDGKAALERLRSTPVDVVLLDLVMEGMDGITVLERLRAAGVDVPVVIMSGINTAWTAAAAMRLGAVDYVTKPCDDEDLLAVLACAVSRAREAAQLRPDSDTARILLMGCPVGVAAALTGALAYYAQVESISADTGVLALMPPVSPDTIVVDLDASPTPRDSLTKLRARFPLASILALESTARGGALGIEEQGSTLLPKPASLRDLLEGIRAELRPSLRAIPRFSARVVGVMEYVSAHFAGVTMQDLGIALEKSPYYLSRLFRSETGMTLKAYVNRVRIEAARRLLLDTSEKIETVAALVGFHDASHLSRLFLKYSGRRPGDFRRTWWEDPVEVPRRVPRGG